MKLWIVGIFLLSIAVINAEILKEGDDEYEVKRFYVQSRQLDGKPHCVETRRKREADYIEEYKTRQAPDDDDGAESDEEEDEVEAEVEDEVEDDVKDDVKDETEYNDALSSLEEENHGGAIKDLNVNAGILIVHSGTSPNSPFLFAIRPAPDNSDGINSEDFANVLSDLGAEEEFDTESSEVLMLPERLVKGSQKPLFVSLDENDNEDDNEDEVMNKPMKKPTTKKPKKKPTKKPTTNPSQRPFPKPGKKPTKKPGKKPNKPKGNKKPKRPQNSRRTSNRNRNQMVELERRKQYMNRMGNSNRNGSRNRNGNRNGSGNQNMLNNKRNKNMKKRSRDNGEQEHKEEQILVNCIVIQKKSPPKVPPVSSTEKPMMEDVPISGRSVSEREPHHHFGLRKRYKSKRAE